MSPRDVGHLQHFHLLEKCPKGNHFSMYWGIHNIKCLKQYINIEGLRLGMWMRPGLSKSPQLPLFLLPFSPIRIMLH